MKPEITVLPGITYWFPDYQPMKLGAPCVHVCDHSSKEVIAWGSTMERYEQILCRLCGCRGWKEPNTRPRLQDGRMNCLNCGTVLRQNLTQLGWLGENDSIWCNETLTRVSFAHRPDRKLPSLEEIIAGLQEIVTDLQ